MDSTLDTLVKKMTTVKTPFQRDDIHGLLLANAFLEDEEVWDLVQSADQESWNYIRDNIDKYPYRVQVVLNPNYWVPDRKHLKMKVVELTDESEARMNAKMRVVKMREFDKVWETLKESVPERPIDELDDELDEAWQALSAARDRMSEYLAKKKSKYIAPSARKNGDADQTQFETTIAECKQEFHSIEKRIESADKEYLQKKKNEFFEDWLLKVQAQVASTCNV